MCSAADAKAVADTSALSSPLCLPAGDFPFGSTCKDSNEKAVCCKGSTSECYARDNTHGGFSCKDSAQMEGGDRKDATNGYCCFNC